MMYDFFSWAVLIKFAIAFTFLFHFHPPFVRRKVKFMKGQNAIYSSFSDHFPVLFQVY